MSNRGRGEKPEYQLKIARERITELFNQAENAEPEFADRYVQIARKIGMRFNVRIPKELRRKFCHKCCSFLQTSRTSRIRTKNHILEIECLKCGKRNRYPMRKTS
ncbi:MAG: ribonuclease P [Candidatus Aenigmarchaeota archaeon]|nr:ribonuclease P [Candidatus Aenigmarchaeota archaeon]